MLSILFMEILITYSPFFLIVWLSRTDFWVVVKADGGAGISEIKNINLTNTKNTNFNLSAYKIRVSRITFNNRIRQVILVICLSSNHN